MKKNTKIYNKWQGYTLADCDCRYCLYYGGKQKSKVICLLTAVSAKKKSKKLAVGKGKNNGSKNQQRNP